MIFVLGLQKINICNIYGLGYSFNYFPCCNEYCAIDFSKKPTTAVFFLFPVSVHGGTKKILVLLSVFLQNPLALSIISPLLTMGVESLPWDMGGVSPNSIGPLISVGHSFAALLLSSLNMVASKQLEQGQVPWESMLIKW